MSAVEQKKCFLSNMFTKAPIERHGFIVSGGIRRRAWEIGDFATSEKPLNEFLPYVLETYRTSLEYFNLPGNDGIPITDLNYGTHIFAVAFGAKPFFPAGKNAPYAEALVRNAVEADKIKEPELENCRPLMRIIEMSKLVRDELGPDAVMGPPNLQTGFDVACILWDKTDLYCSMYEAPDAVRCLAGKCARLVVKFLKELQRECPNSCMNGYVWSPLGPLVSNDECGNMSAEMFESFCLPELVALSKEFGSLAMHCCANAQHQFESFKKIPNFYAFNRVPTNVGWEKDNALDVLGGPKGPVMIPGVGEVKELEIMLQKALPGTRFVFLKQGATSLDEAKQWLDDAYKFASTYRHTK